MVSNEPFINKIKLDFCVNADISDVIFTKCDVRKYDKENNVKFFGEKLCLIYAAEFNIYNVQYCLKILAFAYDKSSEILKLDINLRDKLIEKEIASCRNFLQRHRNLNTAFAALVQFSKFVEIRRLIAAIVFNKEPKIVLSNHQDGGLIIKYLDSLLNVLVCVNWKIDWNLKEFVVVDVIEVYYNNFILPNGNDVRQKLIALTHPALDFHTKLKLWKMLVGSLNTSSPHKNPSIQTPRKLTNTQRKSEADSVLVISDNEDEKNDTIKKTGDNKRRKIETQVNPSVVYVVPD